MKPINNNQLEKLKQQVKDFPQTNGVYLIYDREEQIIYIGKAKNLKARVQSYFRENNQSIKTTFLMSKAHQIDYILTHSEFEALLLENNLIKKHNPLYNISLKDGKTYPVVRITHEKFPRVFLTRQIIQDGSLYYGPFPEVLNMQKYLNLLNRLLQIRVCKDIPLRARKRPCLYFHTKKCQAPCVGYIDEKQYQKKIQKIKRYLSSPPQVLIAQITRTMRLLAAHQEFEKASSYRDILYAIGRIQNQQSVNQFDQANNDYIVLYSKQFQGVFLILQQRQGKIIDQHKYSFSIYESYEQALENFILQYYSFIPQMPDQIILEKEIDFKYIEDLLQKLKKIRAPTPIRLAHNKQQQALIQMAKENAKMFLWQQSNNSLGQALAILQEKCHFKKYPQHIEGIDIAHLGGTDTVGCIIVFKDGKPHPQLYRRFAIKHQGIDDYKSIQEVVARRYTRLMNENKPLPDLLMVDGGIGQVNAAYKVLQALGLQDKIDLCGLAKKQEYIYLVHQSQPVVLAHHDLSLQILVHVRDECHRFATSYNKNLHKKKLIESQLSNIAGIGAKRAQKILSISPDILLTMSDEQLAKQTNIPINLVKKIREQI